MTYRHSLVVRWSRRDRLAVLVIAVTVAFLVGTVLLVVAGGAQTAALAEDFDAAGSATFVEDPNAVDGDGLVLPLALVETPDGDRTLAVGVPAETRHEFGDSDRLLERDGEATLGGIEGPTDTRLSGTNGETTLIVESRETAVVPDDWYVVSPETVSELGTTGALVIEDGDDASATDGRTVPLRSALPFFVAGTGEALRLLGVLAAASGILVGVTVYSVTRMSVLDRREAIEVIRSTGGTPWDVLGSFALRAGVLSAVGAAAGYAIGVIAVASAVNVAVVAGLPTSLDPRVTVESARILVPLVCAVPLVGVVAGVVAAWPTARAPPGDIGRSGGSRLDVLGPDLLAPRVVIPTTATLAAFAVFALVFVAAAGVLLPMLGGGEAVVTQSGSTHPVNSQLPDGYTEAFRAQDIDASGEILLFGVVDDHAVPARGAEYEDFAAVTGASIVDGRAPQTADEAVVGTGAARTLGVDPGDELPLGGSTRVGTTRLTVVGTFDAPTPYSDHVIVSLETARFLSGVGDDRVNLIRGEQLPEPAEGSGVSVSGVSVERPVFPSESVETTITVVNEGVEPVEETVAVRFADQERTVDVSLPAAGETTATATFDGVPAGEYELVAGDTTRTVSVVEGDEIRLRDVPPEAPPGSEPLVRVVDVRGDPVENATVSAGDRTVRTDEDGRVRIPLGVPGEYQVRAERDDSTATASVTVTEGIERRALSGFTVSPSTPDLLVRPTASVSLFNPWADPVDHEVQIDGIDGTTTTSVELQPGERTAVDHQLARQPAGEYTAIATLDDEEVLEATYRVTGDERIAAALATRGAATESPFERAIEVAFGNVQILAGTLVALAGLMAVGATTAAFSGAVYARREALGIRRAAGAPPRQIFRLVLSDALRLGLAAALAGTALGIVGIWLLDAAGLLVTFGVRLLPGLSVLAVVSVVVAALVVALAGAAGATLAVLRVSPASLLADRTATDSDDRTFET